MPLSCVDYEAADDGQFDDAAVEEAQPQAPIETPQSADPAAPPPAPPEQEPGESFSEFPSRNPERENAVEPEDIQPQPAESSDAANSEESSPNTILPGFPERGLKIRFDAARSLMSERSEETAEWQELFEQAVGLLEGLAQHQALSDYAAVKQRLDNVEQLLNSSGNVR